MNSTTAAGHISTALQNLSTAVGEAVFDEWAIVQKSESGWKLIMYGGSRKDEFLADFSKDMAALKETLDPSNLQIGDFAFSHDGFGSGFDAHMVVGVDKLVLFNNTEKNTDQITSNPKWTNAQVHFTNLLEAFIADPLI